MTSARPARAESRILAATLGQLCEHGFDGLTVERVAEAAGVGRATIYRHWASRAELVMAAVRSVAEVPDTPDTGSLRADLVEVGHTVAHLLAHTPLGRFLPVLVEASRRHPDLAELHRVVIDGRRAATLVAFDRAVARGELPDTSQAEVILDMVVGLVFYRHLVLHRPTDPDEIVAIVDRALSAG